MSFKSSLYILGTRPSFISYELCKPMACFFIILTVFYRVQVFKFNELQFIIFFSFINCAFALYQKTHQHTQSHLDFFLCYFLGILYFCILHFRSMINFELIFVKSVRSVSRFILN